MTELLLIGLGPHARAKYIPLIEDEVRTQRLRTFHVLELDSQRASVSAFFQQRRIQPSSCTYVTDHRHRRLWFCEETQPILLALSNRCRKVVIATEPKAHYGYLKSCLAMGLDCLVDKPAVLPLTSDGLPDGDGYQSAITSLLALSSKSGGTCAVMAPRRYNPVYLFMKRYAGAVMRAMSCPITYIHVAHHEGVWNTPEEAHRREDHPYKYGYGMMCHSGYHYVDVLAQLLDMNIRQGYSGDVDLSLHLHTVVDQIRAIGPKHVENLSGPGSRRWTAVNPRYWGETDIISAGSARSAKNGSPLCLFGLDLIQTSTCRRNWRSLPTQIYNKNGRFASESIRINIGPFAAIEVRVIKTPSADAHGVELIKSAVITAYRNGPYLSTKSYREKMFYSGDVRLSADLAPARKKLFQEWLAGRPCRSSLISHQSSSKLFATYLSEVAARQRDADRRRQME